MVLRRITHKQVVTALIFKSTSILDYADENYFEYDNRDMEGHFQLEDEMFALSGSH